MILIIYAHPYPHHSHANKRMLEQARTLEGVEIRSLYQLYPDFNIDIAAEQEALSRADLIVWQHPMQWYSIPPLLKLWIDKVFSHSKAYGRLSVMAQYYCNVIPVLEVPPSAFTPPPKVDSAVVRLVPHATMPHPVKDVRVLSRITTEAFNQRRKTIRNSLGNLFSVEVLTGMGIDPAMRAENISVAQYCQMANYLAENAPLQES